jgi:hypothetical protein
VTLEINSIKKIGSFLLAAASKYLELGGKETVAMYDLMLSRRVNLMKFSRAINLVRWFSFVETNVLKTISVLVLRVVNLNSGKLLIDFFQPFKIKLLAPKVYIFLFFIGLMIIILSLKNL